MSTIFGVPAALVFGQLLLGLINGAFYALISLGLSIIFGMLNVINFVQGAFFMLGAFVAWMLERYLGMGYWWALWLSPLVAVICSVVLERFIISRTYRSDHIYGLLVTYGLAMIIEGGFRKLFGSSGLPYETPTQLQGIINLGFIAIPDYRAWVVVMALLMCLVVWLLVEKTMLGARLRAATENAAIVLSFGIRVPRMITLTYAAGVALAAFAGVLAAPMYSVNPNMGENLVVIGFAVVVIGGMGSIVGTIVTGLVMGLLEALTSVYYAEASSAVIFLTMVLVLLFKPTGLFAKAA